MAAMGAPSSGSSDAERAKKRKKKKKAKDKTDDKKAASKGQKSRKEERRRSRSRSRSARRSASADEPPARASRRGASLEAAPARLLMGPAKPSDFRPSERSRSRDPAPGRYVPRGMEAPSGMLQLSLDDVGGKGKGKGKCKGKDGDESVVKEKPNFEASGLLAMEDNSKNGIPLKFTLPPEIRSPTTKWRLYIFAKGTEAPKIVHIHRQQGFLFGKDRRVVDIPTDHQTCSKQHAVLHYRLSPVDQVVKPYIMDLESLNGTFLNGEKVEPARYYELKEKDMVKFAMSSREYVILHSASTKHIKIDPKQLLSDSE